MVYRMCVLRDFGNTKKSIFGDFIEYEGDCSGKYRISDQYFIKGEFAFTDTILISNSARVCNDSIINAQICCILLVSSSVCFYDNAKVCNYEDFRNEKEICIDNRILYTIKKIPKNKVGELRVEPIIPLALSEIVCVFTVYINKYSANDWRKSIDFGSFHGVILRHLLECFVERIRVLSVICYTWHVQFLVFFFMEG
ncbi:hypothetical protein [Bartonella taylorii]|uniref:hypothetical protein n=1 Tax=Bartonella taylorii TaxID=33046 RepID=UPI001ABAFA75|nr:hypothetical protein [Bartonella taylorii]